MRGLAASSDGDRVRVFNRRGDIVLKARVDGKVQPGVVSASLNWAKMTPGFQSINSLTSEKLTDMGNSATFYSVLVEVELSKPKPVADNRQGRPNPALLGIRCDYQNMHGIKRPTGFKCKESRLGRFPLLYRIMTVFLHPRG